MVAGCQAPRSGWGPMTTTLHTGVRSPRRLAAAADLRVRVRVAVQVLEGVALVVLGVCGHADPVGHVDEGFQAGQRRGFQGALVVLTDTAPASGAVTDGPAGVPLLGGAGERAAGGVHRVGAAGARAHAPITAQVHFP